MADNKPAESTSSSAETRPPGPGVVRLILGKQVPLQAIAEEPVAVEPEAAPAPVPQAEPAPVEAASVEHAPIIRSVLPVWPFVVADVLLVGAALLLVAVANPLSFWVCAVSILLVAAGGVMTIIPLVLNASEPETPPATPQRKFGNRLPIDLA